MTTTQRHIDLSDINMLRTAVGDRRLTAHMPRSVAFSGTFTLEKSSLNALMWLLNVPTRWEYLTEYTTLLIIGDNYSHALVDSARKQSIMIVNESLFSRTLLIWYADILELELVKILK